MVYSVQRKCSEITSFCILRAVQAIPVTIQTLGVNLGLRDLQLMASQSSFKSH